MTGPFVKKPRINGWEIAALVVGIGLFWAPRLWKATSSDEYESVFYVYGEELEMGLQSCSVAWEAAYQGYEIGYLVQVFNAFEFGFFGLLWLAYLLLCGSTVAWFFLHPLWRQYAWDVLGIVLLILVLKISYSYATNVNFREQDAQFFTDFLLDRMVMPYYMFASLAFGHFGRVLFSSRAPKPKATEVPGRKDAA